MDQQTRYKGKFATEKQKNRRLKQIEGGKYKKRKVQEEKEELEENVVLEGRRIVDLQVMSQNLYCTCCKSVLSLNDATSERRKGLASVFSVQCGKCLAMNSVPTSKQHKGPLNVSKQLLYDTNSKAALGAVHSGIGHVTINKFCHVMNIPNMTARTYKKYEREVGPVIENVARESCKEACDEEKALTLADLSDLQKRLPASVEPNFLTPDRALYSEDDTSISTNRNFSSDESNFLAADKSPFEEDDLKSSMNIRISLNDVESGTDTNNNEKVRVFGSYDMRWGTRGTGHQYDSLSGAAHIIGPLSGKVLEYGTRNRKCRMCANGHPKTDHDCRQNFCGTAKAMEPDVANELVNKSSILKEKNIEIGVFIGDNDSSSICAIRKESNHKVIKQSDKNHTAKGVKNALYKFDKSKDPKKELTTDVINYLHKCFCYAMAQNQGNSEKMAAAIKNIPHHAFNIHDNCGEWCGYRSDKENYQNRTVVGRIKSSILFEELKLMFEKLAKNTDTFVSGASTQANESLNAIIARKAPKCIPYSLSESLDYRVASAIGQKNKGEKYIQDSIKQCQLSPGSYLSKHIESTNRFAKLRAAKAKTPKFKLNRHRLRKERTQLKYRQEAKEGETYETDMGLFNLPAVVPVNTLNTGISKEISSSFTSESVAIVFFDLETGGFDMARDILQIAMKCNEFQFNKYIDPTKSIDARASAINGLTNRYGDLYLHGNKVVSSPIRVVMGELLQYLKSLGKPCILVAHNCTTFDAPRLLQKIQEVNLLDEFNGIIIGFADTLPLLGKKFPERKSKKGMMKLTTLAKDLMGLSSEGAHDAMYDVLLLEQLANAHCTYDEFIANINSFSSTLESRRKQNESKRILETLEPLSGVISKAMLKRLAAANITYEALLFCHKESKQDVIQLLEQRIDGKCQLIKNKKILDTILNNLEESD